jgi:hypothetical protein
VRPGVKLRKAARGPPRAPAASSAGVSLIPAGSVETPAQRRVVSCRVETWGCKTGLVPGRCVGAFSQTVAINCWTAFSALLPAPAKSSITVVPGHPPPSPAIRPWHWGSVDFVVCVGRSGAAVCPVSHVCPGALSRAVHLDAYLFLAKSSLSLGFLTRKIGIRVD